VDAAVVTQSGLGAELELEAVEGFENPLYTKEQ
jgi:hypothetical protein